MMEIAVKVIRQLEGRLMIQWPIGLYTSPVKIFWGFQPDASKDSWHLLANATEGNQILIDDPSPGKRSFFKLVADNDALIVAERKLPLEGSPNFRDLGGYLTVDGRSVRWGQLYRSGDLSRLTDTDLDYIQALDLKVICDFRTGFEAEQSPSRSPDGVELLNLPVPGGELPMNDLYQAVGRGDFSSLDGQHLVRANRLFVRDHIDQYAKMLERVGEANSRPALVHCTAGKDRTGLAVAILFWVLGVPTETIFADYLLTNDFNAQRNKLMLARLREHLANTLGERGETIDLSPMVSLTSARHVYLQSAVDTINADYGSMKNFIHHGLGVSEKKRLQLQDELLVELPHSVTLSASNQLD